MSTAVESGSDPGRLNGQSNAEAAGGGILPQSGEPTGQPENRPGREATVLAVPRATSLHGHGLLQSCQSLVTIIIVALFIITFTVQPFRIPSESMVPTLLVGDFLLVDKDVGPEVAPRVMAPASVIHRGDLIIFHYPVDSSLHLVKRVIGLPGDHLHLRSGHVYIDGRALEEPYAIFRPSGQDSYRDDFPLLMSAEPGVDSRWWIQMHSLVANGELTVPADSYFVLGDNRNDSEDSRYWGFVPRGAIVGKPFLIYFSLNDAGMVPGQSPAAALTGGDSAQHASRTESLIDFARWDRAMRVVY